ncbi:MAG: PASTA domain-containing protein [Bacteroidota bacterium]|nr:PASTA domain-containing protein [Bacteroidota bacterium]MDQ6888993.1 PASTA domain-containing protein [Bacteroidota bacterium]
MFKFITRQPFWVNLLAAILLLFLIGFLILQSLSWFTNHGSYLKVPSVTGQKVEDAVNFLEKAGFDVIITDSLYNDSLPLNTVKKQIPDAGATVKVNRTVFININPVTLPMVEMPRLEGLSFRFALEKLQKSHLKLGDTTYRADFMKGSILDQTYNGNHILPGTKLRWGSAVSLVIGGGLVQQQIHVPDLLGLTVSEAKTELQSKGILLAAILTFGQVSDTLNAFVIKQNPDSLDEDLKPAYIQPGQTMDIWISVDRPITDSLKKENPLQQ